MIVYVVLRCEAHEGGTVEHVFSTREKADKFVNDNVFTGNVDYWDIVELEVE
jgi:hypothetical protein